MSKQNKDARAARAAAVLAEQERKARRRQILSVAGVLAALVLLIGGGFVINSMRDTSDEVAKSAPAAGSDNGLTIGEASAPHEIVIYEDFLCPFCGELEKQTHEELATLAADGKVRVEYRPFVLLSNFGPYSQAATAAFGTVLEQSGPEIAKEFHDLLFADQPSEEGPFPDEKDLADLAEQAGADADTVAAVADGGGSEWADAATKAASDIGVNSTPTILLDGKAFSDGRTVDDLASNLLEAVQ